MQVTRIIDNVNRGDPEAVGRLAVVVYDELHRLAAGQLRDERADHTLQPTALVHEAFLKLVDQKQARWKDRAHFLAVAALAIRRLLIDHSRKHKAAKRYVAQRVTLNPELDAAGGDEIDLLIMNDAMERLAERSERQSRVVELRFFGGMSVKEVAHVLDVSPSSVKGDWRLARAWLQREFEQAKNDGS